MPFLIPFLHTVIKLMRLRLMSKYAESLYLEDADGEDGPVVHLPDDLGDSIVPAAPNEHRAVAVAGDHVAVAGEGEARHVLGLVALVEDPRLAGQSQAGR